jgi:hypothetical protein
VEELSHRNFGLVIAYVLPGSVALWGTSPMFPDTTRSLLTQDERGSVAGFLYVSLAALGVGLTLSALRWLTLDNVHHVFGVRRPRWDDLKLAENLEAFNYLVENHYRYYQFYANTLVACVVAFAVHQISASPRANEWSFDLGIVALCAVLFLGSRDALSKYYSRVERLLGSIPEKDQQMTNGNHVPEETGKDSSTRPPRTEVRPKGTSSSKPKSERAEPKIGNG